MRFNIKDFGKRFRIFQCLAKKFQVSSRKTERKKSRHRKKEVSQQKERSLATERKKEVSQQKERSLAKERKKFRKDKFEQRQHRLHPDQTD